MGFVGSLVAVAELFEEALGEAFFAGFGWGYFGDGG